MEQHLNMKHVNFDELAKKVGGRFRLCTMVIKRARLMLLNPEGSSGGKLNSQIIRQALQEIQDGRLALVESQEDLDSGKEKKSLASAEEKL